MLNLFFWEIAKIEYTSVRTNIFHFVKKKLKKRVQRLELKTCFFAFPWENPKVATFDFLPKFQASLVLYCKIDFLGKFLKSNILV